MIKSLFKRSKAGSDVDSADELKPDLSRIFPHLREGTAPAEAAPAPAAPTEEDHVTPEAETGLDEEVGELADAVPTEAWLQRDIDALSTAYDTFAARPNHGDARRGVFIGAHNLKATAEPFGAPAVARLATSLCTLLENVDKDEPVVSLVNLHVQAIRAAGVSGGAAADDLAQAVCVALEDQVSALVGSTG